MDVIIAVGIGVLVIAVINVVALRFFVKSTQKEDGSSGLQLLLQQMNELTKTVDHKIGETNKQVHESMRSQFGDSQQLIKDVNEQVTKYLRDVSKELTESNRTGQQVLQIADQLQDLEKTLKHQKQRGNLGEASLELILDNVLPPTQYEMQYRFPGGDQVDAVVHTKEGIIPIDAKFSLDNYNRLQNAVDETQKVQLEKQFKEDLKKRIDETAKYIRPKDGTLPFAFMFIPAEGIYYDLLVNEVGATNVSARNLIDYAYRDRQVIIVSPTTFLAYLQSVLHGFRAFKIEESAKLIGKRVEELTRHLEQYDEYFKKVGTALKTTVNHYNKADKELLKIDKDIVRITDSSTGIESFTLEAPENTRTE